MKSLLVIGMGRFGKHLARKLMELGNDVMIIDKDESIINTLSASLRMPLLVIAQIQQSFIH